MAQAASIGDHAVIGDGRSAALVDREGAIDWLCWPRFDSPSILASLLDPARGGRFRVGPRGGGRARRRYLEGTNVLESRFEGPGGTLVVTDAMIALPEEEARRTLSPEHEIVRLVACERGEVEVAIELDLRPGYGGRRAPLRRGSAGGLRADLGHASLTLQASAPLAPGEEGEVRGTLRLRAGEEAAISFAYDGEAPAVLLPVAGARERVRATVETWRRWAAHIDYDGPHRAAVVRSALALELLLFAPSGAIVAAPTTSLPERRGGDLNWDYRFCWLRDAAVTVRALHGLGLQDEAYAFAGWLLHATRLTRPELRVLYDVYGRRPPPERTLAHLAGFGGARPVRVGNAAAGQLQLDVYGEVVDAVAQVVRRGARLDAETGAMLREFGEWVCRNWERPDSGIWEPRETPRPRTHSLVLCWTALERLLELRARGAIRRIPAERFERNRALIRERVEAEGWNPRLGSYVADLGGDEVDAALLLLGWYGFADVRGARMRGTWAALERRLGAGDALLYRSERHRRDGEGAFGICSFWAVEHLARGGGALAQAEARLARLVACANDVGLYGEMMDPADGTPLGNFPQAFTHVGLVGAALAVEERAREERAGAVRAGAVP